MINEKGERSESPAPLSHPPHMLEAPTSNAQKAAFEKVKESPDYKAQLAATEKAAEQRAHEEDAVARPAKKGAKKGAKKAAE
jgi:hypothetical protein